MTVLAGSRADVPSDGIGRNPEEGFVLVEEDNPAYPGDVSYLTPGRTGAVRIASYSGTCLALTSDTGISYYFDAATKEWSCK